MTGMDEKPPPVLALTPGNRVSRSAVSLDMLWRKSRIARESCSLVSGCDAMLPGPPVVLTLTDGSEWSS